jgi:PPOX class probable F420-dependent enzyme
MPYSDAPPGWWKDFILEEPARTAKVAVVRADGSPHVAPVWSDLEVGVDGEVVAVVFTTSLDTLKGKAILRDPRVSMCWDDERPPFHFVTVSGPVTWTDDPAELLEWSTRIAGRYMGADRAEEYGRRNAVPPEVVVRVTPARVVAKVEIAN